MMSRLIFRTIASIWPSGLIGINQPQVVYLHHASDVHEAVGTACRSTTGPPLKRLLSFAVASSS